MDALVSVIIPVYNTQDYLKQCLDSVLAQTYSNLQIIIVDDGSTDGSPELCDAYRDLDKRITVIHKKNGGLSSARNAGINIAKGQYFSFLDSDDFWHPEFVSRMISVKESTNVQIVQCKLKEIGPGEAVDNVTLGPIKKVVLTGREAFLDYGYKVSACAKLFDRDLFDNIAFPEGLYFEDEATYYKLAYKADEICMTDDELYFYVQRQGSITRYNNAPLKMDFIPVCEERISFFEATGEKTLINHAYVRYAVTLILNHASCKKRKLEKKTQRQIFSIFKEINRNIDYSKLCLRDHVLFRAYSIVPDFVAFTIAKIRG